MPTYIKAKDIKSLPKDVQFTDEAHEGLFRSNRRGLTHLGLGEYFHVSDSWSDFADYRECFAALGRDIPITADHWQKDTWFGHEFLNGSNPDIIERCTMVPSNFPVTDEIIGDQLEGMKLSEAIEVNALQYAKVQYVEHQTSTGIQTLF